MTGHRSFFGGDKKKEAGTGSEKKSITLSDTLFQRAREAREYINTERKRRMDNRKAELMPEDYQKEKEKRLTDLQKRREEMIEQGKKGDKREKRIIDLYESFKQVRVKNDNLIEKFVNRDFVEKFGNLLKEEHQTYKLIGREYFDLFTSDNPDIVRIAKQHYTMDGHSEFGSEIRDEAEIDLRDAVHRMKEVHNEMKKKIEAFYEWLPRKYQQLQESHKQLQEDHIELQVKKDQIREHFDQVQKDKRNLQDSYLGIKRERKALTAERKALTAERDALTAERDALTAERDALVGQNRQLQREKERLQQSIVESRSSVQDWQRSMNEDWGEGRGMPPMHQG